MNELTTNRDLYLAVTRLTESKTDSLPSLEAYLITLRQLGMMLEKRDSILLDDFYALIRDAFSIQPIRFDDAWVNEYVIETDEICTKWRAWALCKMQCATLELNHRDVAIGSTSTFALISSAL
jgi:hypothetical protein